MQENNNADAIVTSVLFASGDGVALSKLSEITGVPKASLGEYIPELSAKLEDFGLEIKKIGEKYGLATLERMKGHIQKNVSPKIMKPLSAAAVETLAIICYGQPITRARVEAMRGVESKFSIIKLLERDLIEEVGRLDAPGRPLLYGTTETFLRNFGIDDIANLPPLEEFLADEFGAGEVLAQEQFC